MAGVTEIAVASPPRRESGGLPHPAVLAACALLEKTPAPTDEQIRISVESVYCRCTGYVRIEEAYREAVALARKAATT